jgi:cyclic dehypoxanthinyl futalosine synthase
MRDAVDKKIENCVRLTPDEARWCLAEAKLSDLGAWAHKVRCRENPPDKVTYQVDRNINYTNVCISGCRFCAYFRPPGHREGWTLTISDILKKVSETLAIGGTGILLQGGLNPEITLEYYTGLLKAIRARYPTIHIHAFSPPEISAFSKFFSMSAKRTIRELIEAGLDSVPGGGAEILSEPFRKSVSPRKCSSKEWLDITRICHESGLKTSATMVIGLGETIDDRLKHLLSLRELQDKTSGFTAFIPWTFQRANTQMENDPEPVGADDYLRIQACARLILDNFQHHQTSRLTQGMEIAVRALKFGADDFSGVMMEEKVVAAAGAGFHADESEIRKAIESAGFKPVKRLSLYQNIYHG